MNKKLLAIFLIGLSLIGFSTIVNATLIINLGGCDYTADKDGTGSCGGSGADILFNSMIMTFEGQDSDTVRMTLDTANMAVGLGKITDVWFNVNGFSDSYLAFKYVSGVRADSIDIGGNVGNMGIFDFNIEYSSSGPLGDLYYGQTSVYDITGTGLTEEAFGHPNADSFIAAFHMNVTGNRKSGHYTTGNPIEPVPEPATMLLFGTGLVYLAGFSRRQNKKIIID